MPETRRTFLILLQVLLWGTIIALPYFMVPPSLMLETTREMVKVHTTEEPDWARITLLAALPFNISLIIFYYLHHYTIFDQLALRRKFVTYGLTIALFFGAILSLDHFTKPALFPALPRFLVDFSVRDFVRHSMWFLLVWFISLGIKFLTQWRSAEQRATAIETEQLRTELSMLHAQINPHFLFNSLNTVYSLSLKKSDVAPLAVLKLSQLLRYVIEDANHGKVSLEQEVNYLNNYIELQKLRTSANTSINFVIKGNLASTSIAPLLFLPFVENAFKYGISNNEASRVDILLESKAAEVSFFITNKKFEYSGSPSTGIGIGNVQRRLELLYPSRHRLEITNSNSLYSVNLSIQLS
jgi:two-component system LytT family sensor kinase